MKNLPKKFGLMKGEKIDCPMKGRMCQCSSVMECFHHKEEIINKIKNLATKFPVRASDDFDEGRKSMQREVLDIILKI